MKNVHKIGEEIFITNNEDIKYGDYWLYICPINGLDYGDDGNPIVKNNLPSYWFEKLHDKKNYKKIILTTDQKLIEDGIQSIDDEFLEWFVNNPSCEEGEVEEFEIHTWEESKTYYKIIIPKQETLEEAAERYTNNPFVKAGFINGANWQKEQL